MINDTPSNSVARWFVIPGILRGRVARNSLGSLSLKVANLGLAFVASVLLARWLGAAGYGAYSYAMSWIVVLEVLGTFGMDRLLVREMATYQARANWSLMRGILRWSNRMALLISLAVALLAAGAAWALSSHLDPLMRSTLLLALLLLPIMALTGVRQGALRGLHHVVLGQLPEMVIQPLSFVVILVGLYLLSGKNISAPGAMAVRIVTTFVAFASGAFVLQSKLPPAARGTAPVYRSRLWIASALPMLSIGYMSIVDSRADILILGAIRGAEAAGIYAVANRGANLVAFVLAAVNLAVAPTIASLYVRKEQEQLQRMITIGSRISFFASVPIALLLVLSGQWFLSLFGPDFGQGQTALAIMSVGQLINAFTGSVGLILIMTGHEWDVVATIGFGAALNIVLSLLLIPNWGLVGAASSTTITTILWNLVLVGVTYKRLGIHATALGKISLARRAS